MEDHKEISVSCSGCGDAFDCDERLANGEGPCICDDCEQSAAGEWRPDPVYRSGYDYACGYHD